MYVGGFRATQPYQGLAKSQSFSRLVASLNADAKQKTETSVTISDFLTSNASIDDLKKDIESYKSLKYMQGLYRASAAKRTSEAAEFQGLTEQRDSVMNDLEAERAILSNGGSTEPFKVPAWTGSLVTINSRTLGSTVSAEQALQPQPDVTLQISDDPVSMQVSVSDTTADFQPPSPIERSLMKIAALEKKLSDMERKIDEFVSRANISDCIDRESGLWHLRVPLASKILEDSGDGKDGKSPSSEAKNSLFMSRTKENFLEKTRSAAASLEAQADHCADAMSRLYDKYKQKYNISLEELCKGLPSLNQTAEQNERLLALLQKRPYKMERWA